MAMIKIEDDYGNTEYVDFTIDEESILMPLDVFVANGGKEQLLPPTKDISYEVAGVHGEIYKETYFQPRKLDLNVVTKEYPTQKELSDLKRQLASMLNPLSGTKSLVYLSDPSKKYLVNVSGNTDLEPYAQWFRFTIPLTMYDPFIYGTFEKSLIGNGTIKNEGTFETGLIIEISGAITNPSVTIGTDVLTYTGTITSGNTLVIDTLKKTVKIGNSNAVNNFNGVFPLLSADTELNVVAGSNVKIKWRDKWL